MAKSALGMDSHNRGTRRQKAVDLRRYRVDKAGTSIAAEAAAPESRIAGVVRLRRRDARISKANGGRRPAINRARCISPQRAAFLESRTAPLDRLCRDPELSAAIVAMNPVAYANVHIFCGRMWLSTRDFASASREFARAVAVSGRPLTTAMAIAWRAVFLQVLERSAMGRRAIAAFEETGRRRRGG